MRGENHGTRKVLGKKSVSGPGVSRTEPLDLDAANGRGVSSGSVFSTILLNHAIKACTATAPPTRLNFVLDVGCGESPYRDLLAPSTYVGIDRAPSPRPGDLAVIADAMALPVRGGSFDGVVCTEVIEHVDDERALIKELGRVAKPDAKLVLSSPFAHGLHEMPHDFRRMTSIGLVTVIEEAGWTVERISSVGGPFVVTMDSFVRWADQRTRAVARRLFKVGSALHRVTVAPTVTGQKLLAAMALRSRSTALGAIDPFVGKPRLTLGYVVVATRKDV